MNEPQAFTPRSGRVVWPLVFAAAMVGALAPLLYLGIFKFTHHRPLGAATLAVMCTLACAFVSAIAWRLRVNKVVALSTATIAALGLVLLALVG